MSCTSHHGARPGAAFAALLAIWLTSAGVVAAAELKPAELPAAGVTALSGAPAWPGVPAPTLSEGPALLVVTNTRFTDDFAARTRKGSAQWQGLIYQAAAAHSVPGDFLLRLIAQESGFNPSSVSRAGALGIAQFMPATAALVGLRDPFDPEQAIPRAAEHLRQLRDRFGNWGLAAAAYNAGPKRVQNWLGGSSGLPGETVHYVRAITGRDAEDWASAGTTPGPVDAPVAERNRPLSAPVKAAGERKSRKPLLVSAAALLCQSVNAGASRCVVQQRY